MIAVVLIYTSFFSPLHTIQWFLQWLSSGNCWNIYIIFFTLHPTTHYSISQLYKDQGDSFISVKNDFIYLASTQKE